MVLKNCWCFDLKVGATIIACLQALLGVCCIAIGIVFEPDVNVLFAGGELISLLANYNHIFFEFHQNDLYNYIYSHYSNHGCLYDSWNTQSK